MSRRIENASQHDDDEQRRTAQKQSNRTFHDICCEGLSLYRLALGATLCLTAM